MGMPSLELLSNLIEKPDLTIHSVGPYTSVIDCVRQMNEHKIGAMLVIEDDHLVGIFTERDALTRVLGAWLDPKSTRVGEVMTKDPYCVSPTITLDAAMGLITDQRFRHLPVVENGKVLGIVSSGDLTRQLVRDRSTNVRELVDIAGRRRASL